MFQKMNAVVVAIIFVAGVNAGVSKFGYNYQQMNSPSFIDSVAAYRPAIISAVSAPINGYYPAYVHHFRHSHTSNPAKHVATAKHPHAFVYHSVLDQRTASNRVSTPAFASALHHDVSLKRPGLVHNPAHLPKDNARDHASASGNEASVHHSQRADRDDSYKLPQDRRGYKYQTVRRTIYRQRT